MFKLIYSVMLCLIYLLTDCNKVICCLCALSPRCTTVSSRYCGFCIVACFMDENSFLKSAVGMKLVFSRCRELGRRNFYTESIAVNMQIVKDCTVSNCIDDVVVALILKNCSVDISLQFIISITRA